MTMQDITRELEALRKKADDIRQLKSKLEGEKSAVEGRMAELEKKAEETAGVSIDRLPDLIHENEAKIEKYISEIKKMLGGV